MQTTCRLQTSYSMTILPFSDTWNHMQEPQANKKTYWDIAHERKKDAEVYAGVEKDFHPGIKQEVKIFQMTSSPDILPIT